MSETPGFQSYTIERYDRAIEGTRRLKGWYALAIIGASVVGGLLFLSTTPSSTQLASTLRWLTVVWILPVPFVALAIVVLFAWDRPRRYAISRPGTHPRPPYVPTVIFQTTSTGVNVATVENTVRSVLYWTARHPELCYRPEVWLCIEEWGYTPNKDRIDRLMGEGVRVVVTPLGYRTCRGTTRKGRALQYAVEARRAEIPDLRRVWVYHQDDETAVGEDTVLGIDEFVRTHYSEPSIGAGVILYPQHSADFRPSRVQEFHRTHDDVRMIAFLTSRHNWFSGYHGSHYLARADVEDEVGFDVGPDLNSEDLLFECQARNQFGPIFSLLKGFAYEQAALDSKDQIRQRRRWVQGWIRAFPRFRFGPVPLRRHGLQPGHLGMRDRVGMGDGGESDFRFFPLLRTLRDSGGCDLGVHGHWLPRRVCPHPALHGPPEGAGPSGRPERCLGFPRGRRRALVCGLLPTTQGIPGDSQGPCHSFVLATSPALGSGHIRDDGGDSDQISRTHDPRATWPTAFPYGVLPIYVGRS